LVDNNRYGVSAPITSTIRGITSEVRVGPRNGLDHDCVVSCDNISTVRKGAQ
jgi:mRNA interferase MazF